MRKHKPCANGDSIPGIAQCTPIEYVNIFQYPNPNPDLHEEEVGSIKDRISSGHLSVTSDLVFLLF